MNHIEIFRGETNAIKDYYINLSYNYFGTIGKYLTETCMEMVWNFFGIPLKLLYFNGPCFMGIGFWQGKNEIDICSEITGISSSFWIQNKNQYEACINLVEAKFNSFFISIIIIIYLVSILFTFKKCIYRK